MRRQRRKLGTRESLASQLLLHTKVHFATLILLGWFLFLQLGIWGEAGSQQKPNQLRGALCFALVWFFFFPPKAANPRQSKQTHKVQTNPGLEVEAPWALQDQQMFYSEAQQRFLGRQGCACWQLPGQICVSTEFCAALSPSFLSPADLKCALFSAFHGQFPFPRAGRGIKPRPEQAAPAGGGCGMEVLMCQIKPSRWEGPWVGEAHLNTNSPCQPKLRLYKLAKRRISALISLP